MLTLGYIKPLRKTSPHNGISQLICIADRLIRFWITANVLGKASGLQQMYEANFQKDYEITSHY